jgi:hypothetical protein
MQNVPYHTEKPNRKCECVGKLRNSLVSKMNHFENEFEKKPSNLVKTATAWD